MEKLTCDDVLRLSGKEEISVAAAGVIKNNCVACHHDSEEYSEFSGYHLFKKDGSLEEDTDMEIVLDRVFDGSMPQGGYVDNVNLNTDQQQKILECYLEQAHGNYTAPAEKQEDLDKIHQLEY